MLDTGTPVFKYGKPKKGIKHSKVILKNGDNDWYIFA